MGKNIHEKTRGKTSSHRTSFKMYPCREQNRAVQYTQYSQLTLDIRIFLIKTFKRRSRILWMEWEICKCVCIWLTQQTGERDKCNRNGERVSWCVRRAVRMLYTGNQHTTAIRFWRQFFISTFLLWLFSNSSEKSENGTAKYKGFTSWVRFWAPEFRTGQKNSGKSLRPS